MSEKYKASNPEGIYFITSTIVNWIDVFIRGNQKEALIQSLKYCQKEKGLIIYAWVLMSNHLHMVCKAVNGNLPAVTGDFKRFTSKQIIHLIKTEKESRRKWMLEMFAARAEELKRVKKYKVWQDGFHPIELYSNRLIDEKITYIHNNPVKEQIVEKPEDYLYSSARDYVQVKGLLDVEVVL